jgi:F-type H+-transporting ATPase subunit a
MIAIAALSLALLGAPTAAAQDPGHAAPAAAQAQPAHGAEASPVVDPTPGEHADANGDAPGHGAEAGHGAAAAEGHGDEGTVDFMHHILDSHEWELPAGAVIHFPAPGTYMLGPIDLTPTKHAFFLLVAALLTVLTVSYASVAAKRGGHGPAKGRRYNLIESIILFVRDELVMGNIGEKGARFAPFVITLFFFILFSNLLGLLPWGSTATANIAVTAALAVMVFLVTEISGMRALGAGYIKTIVYWDVHQPLGMRIVLALLMTPVELISKFTKPFALAIRLMANMTAGHIVILALINLIFVFGALMGKGSLAFAGAVFPVVMAVAIMFLELFVAFLQAYVFAMLTSVFIGQLQHEHH